MEHENITDPTLPNFIEPSIGLSAEEQIAKQDEEQAVIDTIFQETRIKVSPNDPSVQLVLALKNIAQENLDIYLSNVEEQLNKQTQKILLELENKQKLVVDRFDDKLEELKDILDTLENQKQAIVADVWGKLHVKVSEQIEQQLSKDLQAIANNANNKVNNQRNMLIGGVGGILVGIVLCSIILLLFN